MPRGRWPYTAQATTSPSSQAPHGQSCRHVWGPTGGSAVRPQKFSAQAEASLPSTGQVPQAAPLQERVGTRYLQQGPGQVHVWEGQAVVILRGILFKELLGLLEGRPKGERGELTACFGAQAMAGAQPQRGSFSHKLQKGPNSPEKLPRQCSHPWPRQKPPMQSTLVLPQSQGPAAAPDGSPNSPPLPRASVSAASSP